MNAEVTVTKPMDERRRSKKVAGRPPRPRGEAAGPAKVSARAAVAQAPAPARSMPAPVAVVPRKTRTRANGVTAEEMGARQREISVSEFFTKNRHLLGFDSPRKA